MYSLMKNYRKYLKDFIGVGRVGGARGAGPPPNNLRGGATYPLPPPHPPNNHTYNFFQFLCETGKNHKCTKLKGKIIIKGGGGGGGGGSP